jgi:hypothetical protein
MVVSGVAGGVRSEFEVLQGKWWKLSFFIFFALNSMINQMIYRGTNHESDKDGRNRMG